MATKPASLAVITLDGFQHYLLPADRALKIVALMEGAVSLEQDYTSRNFARKEWVTKNETTVSYETAKADSIRTPEGEAAQMRRTLLITWPELVALAITNGIDKADQVTIDAAQAAIDKAAARPAEGI